MKSTTQENSTKTKIFTKIYPQYSNVCYVKGREVHDLVTKCDKDGEGGVENDNKITRSKY